MLEKILWIVPSRNRPKKLERFLDSWTACTSGYSDMLIALDDDDSSCDHLMSKYKNVIWEKSPPPEESFLEVLNNKATKYSSEYAYIGFNEDDAIFHTPNYEEQFIQKLKELGKNGIVYANDMINKRGRIYFPVMDSSIIKRLGYMVPTNLRCMYADDFWRDLGKALDSVYRFENIVIQHLHYTRDDGVVDNISEYVDASKSRDADAYKYYVDNRFAKDLEILK